MTDYIKRVQTKVNFEIRKTNKELGVSKQQVRETFAALGIDANSPSEEDLQIVFSEMVSQHNNLFSKRPIEITPESHPDVWETLQPPAAASLEPQEVRPSEGVPQSSLIEHAQQEPGTMSKNFEEENTLTNSNDSSELTKSISPSPTGESGLIPQSEVAGMVAEAFAGQPPQIQEQITEYAMERTFSNVSQVQKFLEQLRSMEFNLLIKALDDHFQRRGSMLTVLNEVLVGQKEKDEEASKTFFKNFNNRLAAFQSEMNARLTKQGL